MSLHTFIPDKILSKAPHAIAWLAQTIFAAAFPEIYQKMPQHVVISYLGLTPENFERLKYVLPAFVATVVCYKQQIIAQILHTTTIPNNNFKCCMGN